MFARSVSRLRRRRGRDRHRVAPGAGRRGTLVGMRCMRAAVCLVAGWGLTCAAAGGPIANDDPLRIDVCGTLVLPDEAPDATGMPVRITGLSGVAWLGEDRYVAVLDNSDVLLFFTLDLSPVGKPLAVRELRAVRLAAVHDFEDVAVCPEPLRARIAERQARRQGPDPGACLLLAEEDTPAIRAVSQEGGELLGVVPLPEVMKQRRPNRGPESLAVDPDDGSVWTANEEALAGDGPLARIGGGTVVRIVRIPLPADPPGSTRQYAYAVEPPHAFVRVFAGEPLAGVCALVALGSGRLLVLERAAGPGVPPFKSRIFLVDTTGAADVAAVDRDLAEQAELPLRKSLVWEDALGCNLEGLCLGPPLRDGRRAMVGVADNGGMGTPNQLIGMALRPPPRRPQALVIGVGVGVVAVVAAWAARRLSARVTSP